MATGERPGEWNAIQGGILDAARNERPALAGVGAAAASREAAASIDPSSMSVADVIDYVEAHPNEAKAVLAAEMAGKARKGIVVAFG